MSAISRRDFLRTSALAGAGLVIGFHLSARAAGANPGSVVNTWLRIAPDSTITLYNTVTELGQGAVTPLVQVMAEELDVDPDGILVEQAPLDEAYIAKDSRGNRYMVTWGSTASRRNFRSRRGVAAAARMMLTEAAAQRWSVAATECAARQGNVVHIPSGRQLTYGELAESAAKLAVPAKIVYKPKSEWKLIGTAMPRRDIPAKTDGSAKYGIDTDLPGLLVATIAQCPVYGGRLKSLDPAPALRVKGVKQVVRLNDAVTVVASGYWQARKGLAALKPVWDEGPHRGRDSAEHARTMRAAVDAPQRTYVPAGGSAAAVSSAHEAGLKRAVQTMEALYEAPFLAHAPLEPMNGTALVNAAGAQLWLPTQYQSMVQEVVAEQLGLPLNRVTVNTTLAGGGFGRRIEVDYAVQAALIAKQTGGRPVKLIWSREEDMTRGYYRGAATARLRAGLDAQGMPTAFGLDATCPTILDYSIEGRHQAKGTLDDGGMLHTSDTPYSLVAQRLRLSPVDLGVPVTFWRSVHASTNGFFVESFIDELAGAAGVDPLAYRRRLLQGMPRELAVLEKLAVASGWDRPAAAGRQRGLALYFGSGSMVGEVVELSVDQNKAVRLHRITCVVDCGVALNPDSVRAQMEGGIVFGLSAAMFGEITVKNGAVEQTNFHSYPLLTLAQTPRIDVHIIANGDDIGGVGEESVPQVAPAIAGALFAATGQRVRSLPFSRHGFRLA